MEELLRVEHLRKIFTAADRNDFLAVDDVTFSIGQGKRLPSSVKAAAARQR